MAKTTKVTYHCDGYYFNNVCPSRGMQDPADIRKDSEGWLRQSRCVCKTNGLNPMDNYEFCRHCAQHKHMFRKEGRVLTGHVVEVTPFKAITNDYLVAKAYKTRKSLLRFLTDKPHLTGLNVVTGQILKQGV
jgi:hypothetical protein